MEFNWTFVIFIIIALVAADKLLTVANINAVEKNFPNVDPLIIEKNILAKTFFKQHELLNGSLLYFLFSLFCTMAFLFLFSWTLKLFGVNNALSISLYVIIVFYGLVIANNFYFLLKYSRVIP